MIRSMQSGAICAILRNVAVLAVALSAAGGSHAQSFSTLRDCDATQHVDPARKHLVSLQVENDLFAGTDSRGRGYREGPAQPQ